jgi:hypothetical protein
MFKSIVSALQAQNATETTETEGTAIPIPQKVAKCIGVGIQIKAAGLTTLESISGVLRLKSDTNGLPGGDQQFPLPMQNVVTSGAVALNPFIHPASFEVTPGATITPAVIMDQALTVNPSWRVHLIFA